MILRIVFVSGRVAEERGTELSVAALFAQAHERVIDYIVAMDLESSEVAVYADEKDERFQHLDVLFINDVLPRA